MFTLNIHRQPFNCTSEVTDAALLFGAEASVAKLVDMSKSQVSLLVMYVIFITLYRTWHLSMIYYIYMVKLY